MPTTDEQHALTATQLRSLSSFDELPDAALVDVHVVAALCGFSVPTAWRLARTGKMPAPMRITSGTTRWRVSAVREWLRADRSATTGRAVRAPKGSFAVGGAAGATR